MDTAARSGDTLTFARARGRRLAKLVLSDGTIAGYEDAKHFDFAERAVAGLTAVATVLRALEARHDLALVRGAILDPNRCCGVRRLVHPCKKTGDAPTLVERPRWYLALDFDAVPLPADVDARDLAACAAVAIGTLPPEFHGVRHIVAATGSHLLKPGARLRIWFWLSRPVGQAELKRWLRAVPVDKSIFNGAQLTYTSGPVLPPGMPDPVPVRTVMVEGTPAVAVPSPAALAAPPHLASPSPSPRTASGSRYATTALARAAAKVASAPVDSRHPTCLAEAWSLARLVAAGLLTEGEVATALGAALERAGKTKEEGQAIVTWAVSQRTDTGNLPTTMESR